MVRIPATTAHQQINVFGFDNQPTQILQLEAEVAAITLCNRVFAGGKPVTH
jgi:hypothetical protein